nr:class I SAM-dependent methyltransferase [Candidatus Rhodoblastus alkanivorans]
MEVGVDRGVSYAAFCEAALRLRLDCRLHGVDLWSDPGGDERFDDFAKFHDHRYAGFSRLMRIRSVDALDAFADGSIDLLHINASGGLLDAREEFRRWRKKISPRGIVLIHGEPVEDLHNGQSFFVFPRGEGLALAAPGPQTPDAVAKLFALDDNSARRLRERFGLLGERWAERATILGLLRQFESDFQTLRPKDEDFRLTVADRFRNSLIKTAADPFRYFRPKRRRR